MPERLGQPAADRKTIALMTSSEVNTHVTLARLLATCCSETLGRLRRLAL